MYGFVNYALEQLILRNFGEETWTKIKKEAGVEIEGNFMIRVIYTDDVTYSLVTSTCKVLDLPASQVLQLFGQFFFEFCVESGYDKILSLIGSSMKDFLENLDALHDHLNTIYPGMKAPSFRCTTKEDGSFVLHYYSDRPGLEFIVIGLVKTIAARLHNKDVDCTIIKSKGQDGCDHIQFHIQDKYQDNKEQNVESTKLKANLDRHLSSEPMISPHTFSHAFPFHIIFDRHMRVRQCGSSIGRIIPRLKRVDCKLTDIFTIIRPHISLDFQSICSQIMSVFVLSVDLSKQTAQSLAEGNQVEKSDDEVDDGKNVSRFKGQMVYLKGTDMILFQCSPSMSLNDLYNRGLNVSDIPLYDANRDLIVMNEKWEEEWQLTRGLEILTDHLQKALFELETEKKKTDNLLYSILPPSIAQQLRHNKPVPPARYDQVTLMFASISDFGSFCVRHANDSQTIVNLLNRVFTKFDEKLQAYPQVYKVETVLEKYMAVCGLPEQVAHHTKYMCLVAMDIMECAKELGQREDGHDHVITIGINCGEVMTGVIGNRMPRYCLFGDTVNLTSRCETTGIKGKINVSEFAYEHLLKPENSDPSFLFEYRGEVPMKGKPRPVKMWLLSRRPPPPPPPSKDSINLFKCPFSSGQI